MDRDAAIESLILFNEKATHLRSLSFTQMIDKIHYTINATGGSNAAGSLNIERGYPNGEAIEAFILTFRFFIQDKDKISFRKMSDVYETAGIDACHKRNFDNIRNTLNNYLDSSIPMNVNGKSYTRQELIDIFIYGALAHTDASKKAIYESWSVVPVFFGMIEFEFVNTLASVFRAITFVKNLNEMALQQLQSQD